MPEADFAQMMKISTEALQVAFDRLEEAIVRMAKSFRPWLPVVQAVRAEERHRVRVVTRAKQRRRW